MNGYKVGAYNELLLKVDSKTQAYLDDFIKRKKEMLVTAKSVTLSASDMEEANIKEGDTEEEFEKAEVEEDSRIKEEMQAYYDEKLVATGACPSRLSLSRAGARATRARVSVSSLHGRCRELVAAGPLSADTPFGCSLCTARMSDRWLCAHSLTALLPRGFR